MLSLNNNLKKENNKFQRTIQRRFEIDKLPKKLQDWYLFTYDEFIKELGKRKLNYHYQKNQSGKISLLKNLKRY